MKVALSFLLVIGFLVPLSTAWGSTPRKVAVDTLAADTTWSGEVLVEKPLTVAKGATLTIKPGTVVRFNTSAGLTVSGVLKASGSKTARIKFMSAAKKPKKGDWAGIALDSSGLGTVVSFCRIEHAASLSITTCSPEIKDNELVNGETGIALARKAASVIRRNRIKGMTKGGIICQMGSTPFVTGNTIEDCGGFGVSKGQDAQPAISGNAISGCVNGIYLDQSAPPVEDNTVTGCKTGIMLSGGEGMEIRGNRVMDNDVGIVCQQFSNPLVVKNLVKGNKQGIVCFRSSSPTIKNNELAKNGEGLVAIQICNPRVTANSIHDNGKAIYLDMSSYAVVNGNNIYNNKVQMELGNMSSDWERRIREKPVRGSQAQNFSKADRGKVVRQIISDDAKIMGFVDATGNWWGDATTREMAQKGADANIAGFTDYYDVPVRTYEGYEGEYVQDRIKYEGWKASRIKDTGM